MDTYATLVLLEYIANPKYLNKKFDHLHIIARWSNFLFQAETKMFCDAVRSQHKWNLIVLVLAICYAISITSL